MPGIVEGYRQMDRVNREEPYRLEFFSASVAGARRRWIACSMAISSHLLVNDTRALSYLLLSGHRIVIHIVRITMLAGNNQWEPLVVGGGGTR